MKSGVYTTEFWLAMAALVAATVMLGIGRISPEIWAGVVTGVSGLYGVSRGIAKVNAAEKKG